MLTSLTRPLIFLDLETTDKNVKEARIVQFCFKKYFPDGEVHELLGYLNPVVPISDAAIKIHGVTNDDVKDWPTFAQMGSKILEFISGCDIVGYNSNVFDLPVLYNEMCRVGLEWDYTGVHFIDACNIFKINEPRDLEHAYKHYTGKTLIAAHNAGRDVDATVAVFVHQLEKHGLEADVEKLALYSNYGQKRADLSGYFIIQDDDYFLNFGKYKGKKAKDCVDYILWMDASAFPPDTKRICKRILNTELV